MFQNELKKIGNRIKELRESKGWTQEILAEKLNIARNTLTKLEGGFRDFKTTELINIAKVLEVSTDYLLGRTRVAAPDEFLQTVGERYGLSDKALKVLSDMPALDIPFGAEYAQAMSRHANTMTYREILNLLLSNEHGKQAIEKLALYYFGKLDRITQENLPVFDLPRRINRGKFIKNEVLTEDIQREALLQLAIEDLRVLREVQDSQE